jgi:hypothetical protein
MTIGSSHVQILSKTVSTAIGADRIGSPVFVRWMERVESDPVIAVERALEIVSGWYGSAPEFSHQPGGSDLQSTVLARWPGGQSALLIAAPIGSMDTPGLDLAVIGSKGAVYHSV